MTVMKLGVWLAFLDMGNGNPSSNGGKTIDILLYKGLKGKAGVPTDDLIPKTRRARNRPSFAFQTPHC